ncbi:winged helix-turn-helix transcriptional regulator [Acetobacterium bakii]|uniref:HxlR family transcriptional regulator n=1 Tax=Acetobacterium bakii TaxID=52689 RepID=A0A0L6U4N5_9FIRM|nr:helix-turn-helix domain-containing protein [Acetobacterium bakii]KNZ43463.1 HxlR family transcriptional regulator [Acetobacterium bakii]
MSASDHLNHFCSENICPCQEKCPLSTALGIIGGKWKIPILCALNYDGPTRYNALRKKIKGVTNTMLVTSLKELEADGLVLRTQYNEMPLRVEYKLTENTNNLLPILGNLTVWGKEIEN